MNKTKQSPVQNGETRRTTAIVVGVLFIIGTAAGVLSAVFTQPVLNTPDYLLQISGHENQIVTGVLMVLSMGLALALVPVLLYPIFKKHDEALALGYLVFRGALETVTYIGVVCCWLLLIEAGREYRAAGTADAFYFITLGKVLLRGSEAIGNITVIVFSLDALMLYTLLYRSSLVPRWISIWGFIAILLHFSTAFLKMYQVVEPGMFSSIDIINLPIFLQEMVMAVWLIVKGFTPSAATPKPAVQLKPV